MESQMVPLRGKKVVLRPLDPKKDIEKLLKWMNDPEVVQFLSGTGPFMRAEEERWLASLSDPGNSDSSVFGIETFKGKFIGTIGLHNISWRNRTAFSGCSIGEKEYWGKGYGGDAKMLQLAHAFLSLNLRKICSNVLAFNRRSERYLLKTGYQREGLRKKQIYRNGKYWDEIQLAVFAEDWLPKWKEYRREL